MLDNEDSEMPILTAVEAGRVRDMQVRAQCYKVATDGKIPHMTHSLAGCSKLFLGLTLDKGDPDSPETSARLTFRRYNDDGSPYIITQEQAVYLAYDCISTELLAQVQPEQPTEIQHTKGLIVLAHISANGMQVDRKVFDALVDKLIKTRDEERLNLVAYGSNPSVSLGRAPCSVSCIE